MPIIKDSVKKYLTKDRTGNVTVLDTVDSTNNYLKKLAIAKKADYYDVIIARTQTCGRGRLGRSFSSAVDVGIYLSYLMSTEGVEPEALSEITAWTAVAVKRAIVKICNINLEIKWVNDLVYGSKKLCGILTELFFDDRGYIIIGIGINVNHSEKDFPSELCEIATSLRIILNEEVNISRLCAAVITELDVMTADFPLKKKEYISEYRTSCSIVGKKCRIIKDGNERLGTVLGVDDRFGLVIDFDDGKRETVTGGEVSVRGFYGYI